MTTEPTTEPTGEPPAGSTLKTTILALWAQPLVQWAVLILVMLLLLAVTKSAVAESPYNNF